MYMQACSNAQICTSKTTPIMTHAKKTAIPTALPAWADELSHLSTIPSSLPDQAFSLSDATLGAWYQISINHFFR
jgi:hypothetical protein